jgi:hypothetical protein
MLAVVGSCVSGASQVCQCQLHLLVCHWRKSGLPMLDVAAVAQVEVCVRWSVPWC